MASRTVKIQLAEVGEFKGHPAGPFALTPSVFDEIIANFRRDKLPIPIDAEHASEADSTSGSIPSMGAPAMGWIHDLENRGDRGLWGDVEWLEPAKTYIKEGRYRYLSPAVRFNARDRVTGRPIGARLTSAAIVNQPFLRNMAPLVAKDGTSAFNLSLRLPGDVSSERVALSASLSSYSAGDFMPRIKSALAMHALSTPAACMSCLDDLRDAMRRADAGMVADGHDLTQHLSPLRTLANLPATATWDEILDVVDALLASQIDADDDDDTGVSATDGDAATSNDSSAAMSDAAQPPASPAQDTPMADQKDEVTTLSARITDLEKEKATIHSVKLRAEADVAQLSTKLADTEAKVSTLESENKRLRDEHAKWETAAVEHDVDEAIANATDAFKGVFCASNRDYLIGVRRRDGADAFAKISPPAVAPNQRHLKDKLVTDRGDQRGDGIELHTRQTLTVALMKGDKLPFPQAQQKADRLFRENDGIVPVKS